MTVFVDANILIYGAVESDYRSPCLHALDAIARGDVDGRTSTAVLEEVWHVELSGRAGSLTGLAERAYTLFTPLLPVTDDALRAALSLDAPALGANDRVHVGTCVAHEIDAVLTADHGFAGVRGIRAVDPLDDRALRRLLRDSVR